MKILLADDHPMFLEAAQLQLERADPTTRVITAQCLDEAIQVGRAELPLDIAVLDLRMPGMEHGGVARAIAALGGVPVMVMSGGASAADVQAILAEGAQGFLPKTVNGAVFAGALAIVAAGGSYVPIELLTQMQPRGTAAALPEAEFLTPRETDVLAGLVAGRSNKEIGRDLSIEEVTVKLHARRIFRKLGVRNRAEAAAHATRNGLLPR